MALAIAAVFFALTTPLSQAAGPDVMTIVSGTPQSITPAMVPGYMYGIYAFASPMVVKLTNSSGTPIKYATIQFRAVPTPNRNQTCTFIDVERIGGTRRGNPLGVQTDSNGLASINLQSYGWGLCTVTATEYLTQSGLGTASPVQFLLTVLNAPQVGGQTPIAIVTPAPAPTPVPTPAPTPTPAPGVAWNGTYTGAGTPTNASASYGGYSAGPQTNSNGGTWTCTVTGTTAVSMSCTWTAPAGPATEQDTLACTLSSATTATCTVSGTYKYPGVYGASLSGSLSATFTPVVVGPAGGYGIGSPPASIVLSNTNITETRTAGAQSCCMGHITGGIRMSHS
jgi:hypothetical protein